MFHLVSYSVSPLVSVGNLQTLAASTVSVRREFVQQPQAVSVSALLAPTERSRHSWDQSQHYRDQVRDLYKNTGKGG